MANPTHQSDPLEQLEQLERREQPDPPPPAAPPQVEIDDVDALLQTLPAAIRRAIEAEDDFDSLLEIVLDLGRRPSARYREREIELTESEITTAELEGVVRQLGEFGDDNRAGIARTLHRISCLRNRRRKIVGLTMRVGRAVSGSVALIEDLVAAGASILLLGRPGVGKTTLLREVARVLAEQGKRVVIVDTSNEIAGDGDIPHAGIGRARRMQVETPERQHAVMVEAVENHMPEVIVIDEIGTELEALAARTIAERGVQLVATAHGNTLANLMLNPTLADLIGGIQTVTLSDEEARRRGTRKSVLERKAPPTFNALVEIQSFTRVAVQSDVGATVDAMLHGETAEPEIREVDEDGEVHSRPGAYSAYSAQQTALPWRRALAQHNDPPADFFPAAAQLPVAAGGPSPRNDGRDAHLRRRQQRSAPQQPAAPHRRIFPLGVSAARLREAIRENGANASVVDRVEDADVVMTLRSAFRRRPADLRTAESRRLPIVVLKHNTVLQMQQSLRALTQGAAPGDELTSALAEAEDAIQAIHSGVRDTVELAPRGPYIRKLQHEMAARQSLTSSSRGQDPHRRVRIQSH